MLRHPQPGDVLSCWFPEDGNLKQRGRKFRPVFVLDVYRGKNGLELYVAYGTSQRPTVMPGQFVLYKNDKANWFFGKDKHTRFDLGTRYVLPYSPHWFASEEFPDGRFFGNLETTPRSAQMSCFNAMKQAGVL